MLTCFVLAGLLILDYRLTGAARPRQLHLNQELPDVIELLALAVGAGEPLYGALQRADSLAWDVQSLVDGGVEDVRDSQYDLDFPQIKTATDAIRLINQADADAFAAHLKIIGMISPTGAASKKSPDQALSVLRQPWINAAKSDVASQNRFGVPPSQILVQLWP